MREYTLGDKVSLPGCELESHGTILELDKYGRWLVEWQDGSQGYYMDEDLRTPGIIDPARYA